MPSPEKILLYGRQGAGKTYQIIKTAQWLIPSGAHIYVCDSDDSYERSLEAPEFKGKVPNIHPTFVYGWKDYTKWVDDTKPKIRPFVDWMVVDRADKAWRRVQEWYGQKAYGKDLAELMAENKKKKQMVVSPFDQADWLVINAEYFGWFNPLMYEFRANIIFACAVEKIQDKDSDETKNLYSAIGINPSGQKEIGHEPHTVMLMWQDIARKYYIRTIKDRGGRIYFMPPDDLLVSFPHQYLMMRASWSDKGPGWMNGTR